MGAWRDYVRSSRPGLVVGKRGGPSFEIGAPSCATRIPSAPVTHVRWLEPNESWRGRVRATGCSRMADKGMRARHPGRKKNARRERTGYGCRTPPPTCYPIYLPLDVHEVRVGALHKPLELVLTLLQLRAGRKEVDVAVQRHFSVLQEGMNR